MFHSTRLKLTAWYLLILMFISISFSFIIYKGLSNEIDRFSQNQRLRIERRLVDNNYFPQPPSIRFVDPDLIEESKHHLAIILLFINGGIFFVVGILSYFLAGKTLKPIQEMIDEQNRFISDASHELRTPLTALKSSFEVDLRDKNLTVENAKKTISAGIIDINNLQRLSDSLLQLSQYEKPQTSYNFEKVSLKQVMNESAKKIETLAKNRNIRIKSTILNVNLKGDKYGLVDLFVILLDNAIKYSQEKTTVVIDDKKIDGLVLVTIKDQGIGIAKKDLSQIFKRFYRSDAARSKKEVNGYGLGLSIAKKIVDQHKGSIVINSELKKGTTVIVRLPIFS
ncbi:sensor histidine kinase [bacterium]|nr:MAG: sensor histidine kinase [bacterium]